ncbi:hypothetical protein GCM10018779_29520 [Streptomyces griseocarneus]|nr:hypothetical protein GCM10018779_29520 [Streptomyces griseocarneus]
MGQLRTIRKAVGGGAEGTSGSQWLEAVAGRDSPGEAWPGDARPGEPVRSVCDESIRRPAAPPPDFESADYGMPFRLLRVI